MIKENISFLACAGSIETREYCFYKSPFIFSQEDKTILTDNKQRAALMKALEKISMPIFIIEHNPYNSSQQVDKYARMDSYILKLALLIYTIRLKINEEGESERFLWTGSEEAFTFLSDMDHEQVIDCLIKREISLRPVSPLSEIINGSWEANGPEGHKMMTRYLQLRYKHWRAA
ncbi:hypothetical protein ACI0X9_003400 [Cronobacter turicensis]